MGTYTALKYAFALAGGLAVAGCNALKSDRTTLAPEDVSAVGFTQTLAGDFQCNFAVIGLELTITSEHCADNPLAIFSIVDKEAHIVQAKWGNRVQPTSAWVYQQDTAAGESLQQDGYYQEVALDKAIVLLTKPIGEVSGTMDIAPLDAASWHPLEDHPDMMIADVKLITHWPNGSQGVASTFYAIDCQAVRKIGVEQVIAHNCPTKSGVSGSPLVIGEEPEDYAIIAVHQGKTMKSNQDLLAQTFAPAFEDRSFNFASVVGEMDELCEQLKNCRAQRKPNGYAVLALTN
jgi:V8-like Glu-specific endopeptidase